MTIFTSSQVYFNGHYRTRNGCSDQVPPSTRVGRAASFSGRRPSHGFPAVGLLGVCLASVVALLPPLIDISRTLVIVGFVNASMLAMAYALLSIVSNTDKSAGDETGSSLNYVEILQLTATRAFALVTLYLAFFSIPFPDLPFQGLMFASLRATQAISVLYLVGLPSDLRRNDH